MTAGFFCSLRSNDRMFEILDVLSVLQIMEKKTFALPFGLGYKRALKIKPGMDPVFTGMP